MKPRRSTCIEVIEKISILKGNPSHLLRYAERIGLAESCEPSVFGRGQQLDVAIGVVLGGVLGVRHVLSDGRAAISTLFFPGYVFDLRRDQGLLIACLADTRIARFSGETFDRLVRTDPDFSTEMIAHLEQQHVRERARTADLLMKTPIEKTASLLLDLGHRFRTGDQISLPMQQADIAEYLGMTPETLSRTLTRLQAEGVVRKSGAGDIEVTDPALLIDIARGGRPRRQKETSDA